MRRTIATTTQHKPVSVPVLANDRDPDPDGLAPPVTIVTPPTHGNANPQSAAPARTSRGMCQRKSNALAAARAVNAAIAPAHRSGGAMWRALMTGPIVTPLSMP